MALFSSLNIALTGLQANMAALQTIGHNIANASTPGYSRQRIDLQPRSARQLGFAQIGAGVEVTRVRRLVDLSLNARIRSAASEMGSLSIQSETYQRLESLFNALSDNDLGSMMDRVFEALDDLANNPDSIAARTQVLEMAQTMTQTMNDISSRIQESRALINDEVQSAVNEINRMTTQIASINKEILLAENGGIDLQSANDLRDQRDLLLRQLSEYIEVHAIETSTGEMNVLSGSAFLVFGQQSYALSTDDTVDDGVIISTPVFETGSAHLTLNEGKLKGLIDSRDDILKGVQKELDVLANSIIFEFNAVQATGQGLQRFSDLTSLHAVLDSTELLAIEGTLTATPVQNTIVDSEFIGFPLDPTGRRIMMFNGEAAMEYRTITAFDPSTGTFVLDSPFHDPPQNGDRFQITDLSFPIVNGSFDIVITNELTGVQESINVTVDLDKSVNPLPPPPISDETLSSIVTQLTASNASISASVTPENKLRIQSTSSDITFSFANDSSGFLAAMGVNAMFTGVDAASAGVNANLLNRPEFLSAAQSHFAGDNANVLAFGNLRSKAVIGSASFEEGYQDLIGRLSVQTAEISIRFENKQLLAQQLDNQRERVSGVNIDEEAVKMLQFQRAFQASARYLGVVDSLLETLLGAV